VLGIELLLKTNVSHCEILGVLLPDEYKCKIHISWKLRKVTNYRATRIFHLAVSMRPMKGFRHKRLQLYTCIASLRTVLELVVHRTVDMAKQRLKVRGLCF
jgi:hypothetical protein